MLEQAVRKGTLKQLIRSFQGSPESLSIKERDFESYYRIEHNFPQIFSESLVSLFEESIRKKNENQTCTPISITLPVRSESRSQTDDVNTAIEKIGEKAGKKIDARDSDAAQDTFAEVVQLYEKEKERKIKENQITQDHQIFKASLPWLGGILDQLEESLLIALNIQVEEKQAFETGVEKLQGKEKLVALLPLAVGKVEAAGLSTTPVKDFDRYKASGLPKPVSNPYDIAAIAGDGASEIQSHSFFNVQPKHPSGPESLHRRSFDLLGRIVIGAAAAFVRSRHPELQGELLKQEVLKLIFKQYPEFSDSNIFQINEKGRIAVIVDQDRLWNTAQAIAARFRSELRTKAAA